MKVGAPKRSGLDRLGSNKDSLHFSPKSLRPLPAPRVLSFPVLHLPGWDRRGCSQDNGNHWGALVHPICGILWPFLSAVPHTRGLDLPRASRVWVFSGVSWWLGNTSCWIRHEKFLLWASGNWIFISDISIIFTSATLSLGHFSSLCYWAGSRLNVFHS